MSWQVSREEKTSTAWALPEVVISVTALALCATITVLIRIPWYAQLWIGISLTGVVMRLLFSINRGINGLVRFLFFPLPSVVDADEESKTETDPVLIVREDLDGTVSLIAEISQHRSAQIAVNEAAGQVEDSVRSIRAITRDREVARWRPTLQERFSIAWRVAQAGSDTWW
jgi:hypothetical protein